MARSRRGNKKSAAVIISPRDILTRGPLILCSLVLAWTAATHAFSQITATSNPTLALKADSDNANALAMQSSLLLDTALAGKGNVERMESLAIEALHRQAVQPMALRQLAYGRGFADDSVAAGKLAALAYRTSRRDLATHVWFIEQAVSRNDIKTALRHYDIAMRTSPEGKEILSPRLSAALEDPEIRSAFVTTMKARPYWMPGFLATAISSTSNPLVFLQLARQAGGLPTDENYPDVEGVLLSNLVHKREFREARAYFFSLPKRNKAQTFSAGLEHAFPDFDAKPFAWQLSNEPDYGAYLGKSGSLTLFASGGRSGTVATKLLYLPKGSYILKIRYGDVRPPGKTMIRWSVNCETKSATTLITRSEMMAPKPNSLFSKDIIIGDNCDAERLVMEILGGDGQAGGELDVTNISMPGL